MQLTFITSERNSVVLFNGKFISELNLNLLQSFILIIGLILFSIDLHILSRTFVIFLLRKLLGTTKYLSLDFFLYNQLND